MSIPDTNEIFHCFHCKKETTNVWYDLFGYPIPICDNCILLPNIDQLSKKHEIESWLIRDCKKGIFHCNEKYKVIYDDLISKNKISKGAYYV